MLLTSAQIIGRYCLPTYCGELPHVTQCIDAFLDVFSPLWNFAEIFSKCGSLHLMQYVANKEPSRSMDPFYRRYLFNRTTWFAAERGDLDAVKWLVESFLPHDFLTKVVNGAAAGGHVEILHWLFDNYHGRACWGGIEMCRALINSHLEAVEWLKRNAPPRRECLKEIMQAAGKAGNEDIIWWLYESTTLMQKTHCGVLRSKRNGIPLSGYLKLARWKTRRCCSMRRTRVPKIAFSLEIGCPNKDAIHAAAAAGRLGVLEWLHYVVGLPLRSEAARNAARNGHLQVVKWFKENDCPGWDLGIMNAAATGGHLKILQWLRENCSDECNVSTMHRAIRGGHLDVMEWLNNNYTIDELSAFVMYTAARNGNFEMVLFLDRHRSEGFNSQAILLEHPCLELTQWLISKYPEQIDGWTIALPTWDWHFSGWCRQVNLQQTPETTTEWTCDSSCFGALPCKTSATPNDILCVSRTNCSSRFELCLPPGGPRERDTNDKSVLYLRLFIKAMSCKLRCSSERLSTDNPCIILAADKNRNSAVETDTNAAFAQETPQICCFSCRD
ncbi:Ankyrin repeat-containing domain [Phytophthora cactorum]|nr:Ankyrin repeat-containing domain [Phytophthora cactorum]